MFKKYSFLNILNEYKKNYYIIQAYLSNKTIEMENDDDKKVMDLSIPLFLTLLIFYLFLWFFALYSLIKYWKKLPEWSQAFGIIGLMTGFGPLLTILVVYIGKEEK